jgi:hypothetical protein
MAYLNAEQREKLVNDLKGMRFNKAKGKVRGMDPNSRLVFYRNSQGVGRWLTRFDLPSLGTRVTLVESHDDVDKNGKIKSEFDLTEVIAEALPDNKS